MQGRNSRDDRRVGDGRDVAGSIRFSSLSDDIIAVPQAMRDGSGLGATRSETVRRVTMPSAARDLAGGLTRYWRRPTDVVMGAGAAGFSLNPFEAMTTVTAKIVSQLTGDADFSSPEALGLALFIHHIGAERLRAYNCPQIPGAVRMSDASAPIE